MFRFSQRLVTLLFCLCAAAGLAAAQAAVDLGPQTGLTAISSSSYLDMSATVNNAIQIDIETAPNGATVTGGTLSASNGMFSLNLGQLNGLGLGTPSAGVTATATTGGVVYSTPVKITPYFAGLGGLNNGTVNVRIDATHGNPAYNLILPREGAAANSMNLVTAVPSVVTTTANSGTAFTRHVGMFIPATGSVVSGQVNVRLVYQILPLGTP